MSNSFIHSHRQPYFLKNGWDDPLLTLVLTFKPFMIGIQIRFHHKEEMLTVVNSSITGIVIVLLYA